MDVRDTRDIEFCSRAAPRGRHFTKEKKIRTMADQPMNEPPSDNRIGHLVQIGLLALKNAMLINGAACIALLTLLGHAATSEKSKLVPSAFALPLVLFAGGVFSAALSSGAAYFGEGLGMHGQTPGSTIWSLVTIGLVVLSLGLFFMGHGRSTKH
jgi:hypothetical protein